jgi:hypothetical protein
LNELLRINGDSIARNTELTKKNTDAVQQNIVVLDAQQRILSITSPDGRFVSIPNTQGTFNGPVVNGGGFGSGSINAQSRLPPIVRR